MVQESRQPHDVLLTGATGYVGGRLLKALEGAGHRIRCLARRPEYLLACVTPPTIVVTGDVLEQASLPVALPGSIRQEPR